LTISKKGLTNAINRFENRLNEKIKDLRKSIWFQLIFFLVLIGISIFLYFYSNQDLITLLGIIGIDIVGFTADWDKFKKALKGLKTDIHYYEDWVAIIKDWKDLIESPQEIEKIVDFLREFRLKLLSGKNLRETLDELKGIL